MAAGEERRRQAVLARISRVRRHLNLEVLARAAVGPVWVSITAFVIWRIFVQRGLVIVALVFGVLAALVTWWLARSRGVSQERASVIADRQAQAGGLLLTRLELPVGEWELGLNQSLREFPLPDIDVRRPVALLGVALCFLVAGMLVPQPRAVTAPPNAAAATRVEELAEKLEAIAKEEPLDATAQEELQRLQEELADNSFDAADWEAADALEAQVDKQAAEASRELERAENAAKNLDQALAQANEGESQQRERDELEKALMELSDGAAGTGEDAMQQAMGEQGEQGKDGQQGERGEEGQEGQQGQNGEQGKEGQQGQNGQQGKEGQQGQNGKEGQNGKSQSGNGPSRSDVNQLRNALAQRQKELNNKFNPNNGNKGQGQGKGQQQGKSQGSGEGQGQGGSNQQGGHASRNFGGEGEPSRGGEAAELVFGEQAEMDPERLALENLPEGNGGEAGELRGLRATNPKVKQGTEVTPATGAGASGDQAAGWDEGAMRPRNRALVQRYFDSK